MTPIKHNVPSKFTCQNVIIIKVHIKLYMPYPFTYKFVKLGFWTTSMKHWVQKALFGHLIHKN